MAITRPAAVSPVESHAIPVIDVGGVLAGAPGALERAAGELRHALEGIGFFIIVNHGVPAAMIERTFAEARRFHDLPMAAKMALRMNEHNNGYMAMGRYAVWTSDVNDNDKPDLNEAFFTKRERPADDPLVRAGRRFAGPNRWPDDLPGFRDAVLAYTDAVDAMARRLLPACAVALDLPPDVLRRGVRGEPVLVPAVPLPAGGGRSQPVRHRAPHRRQLPHVPGPDRGAGAAGADAGGRRGSTCRTCRSRSR